MRNIQKVVAIALAALSTLGCDHPSTPPSRAASTAPSGDSRQSAEIFAYVAGILNGLDQFDTAIALRDDILKLNEAARRLLESGVPPTLTSQLNQWAATQPPAEGWSREPMLESLPAELGDLPQLQQLDARIFTTADGFDLREAVWLRNISQLAAGQTQDDLELAGRLFDWVIRNIQLDGEPPAAEDQSPSAAPLPMLPWQVLLLGHGQAIDRTWIFTLLARQQGLDVVVLSRPEEQEGSPPLRLPALVHNGELFLFDSALGLPIPGPSGEGVATLAQAANDEALLRQLDADADHPYPLKQSDLSEVVALIEASPMYLCERMALVESQLSGDQKIVLSANASGVAQRVQGCEHVAAARLWLLPYERADAIHRGGRKITRRLAVELEPFAVPYFEKTKKGMAFTPALWRGRTLQLFGQYAGPGGASHFYQAARPADAELARGMADVFANVEQLMQINPEEHRQKKAAAEHFVERAHTAKQDASYWLGLIAFERQDYQTALDYFGKRTLEAAADGPWTQGARYNLARTYEALGQHEEAAEAYRQGPSPQEHGNLLRAKKLQRNAKTGG